MWQWYAAIAMACFAGMQLLFKQLTRLGMAPAALLCYVFLVGSALFLLHLLVLRTTTAPLNGRMAALLALTGALGYVGNICAVRALAAAPNAGYSTAIVGLQALLVTLGAIVFFGAAVSAGKLAGVVLCVAGVVLLVI
jgi:drug/metabolite transporter (DMT)-like permease